jgi:hypothetical protein
MQVDEMVNRTYYVLLNTRDLHGCDDMVVKFTTLALCI